MADTLAYVAGQTGSLGIMVVDMTTMTQVHTWQAGTTYDQICITPDGKTLYGTRFAAQSVDAIDAATGVLVASSINLPTGNPGTIAATPDGTRVYVPDGIHNLFAISTSSHTITNTVAITPSANSNVSVPRDNSRAYVVSATSPVTGGIITVVSNTSTPSVTGSITLPSFVSGQTPVAISTDGTKGWVADPSHLKAVPLDLVALTAGTDWTVTTDGTFGSLALTLDHLTLYYGGASNQLSISSTALGAETSVLSGVGNDEGLALTQDGTSLVLTDRASANLRILNTATNTVTTTIPLTGIGFGVCLFPSALFPPPPPPTPPYPGGQFIPKLFIPQKGKQDRPYTPEELRANWMAIEIWSQQWIPPSPVALSLPRKYTPDAESVNANWITLEVWTQKINALGAPYSPLFIPRKPSLAPRDLDIDFLRVQNWANRLPL